MTWAQIPAFRIPMILTIWGAYLKLTYKIVRQNCKSNLKSFAENTTSPGILALVPAHCFEILRIENWKSLSTRKLTRHVLRCKIFFLFLTFALEFIFYLPLFSSPHRYTSTSSTPTRVTSYEEHFRACSSPSGTVSSSRGSSDVSHWESIESLSSDLSDILDSHKFNDDMK